MRRRSYGSFRRRSRLGNRGAAALTLAFWLLCGVALFGFVKGNTEPEIQGKTEDMARLYMGAIFPSVSRGGSSDIRSASSQDITEGQDPEVTEEKGEEGQEEENNKGLFHSMIGSMFPAVTVLDDDLAEQDPDVTHDPAVASGDESGTAEIQAEAPPAVIIDTQIVDAPRPATANIDYSKPVVIIYHTHATESYQPVSDGNFHSLEEYGTVRQVGDELTAALEAKGIQVIHDKTIHDSPSYNQSYSRSLETVKALMGENQSTRVVVDLHRDAAGYLRNPNQAITIQNQKTAKYSLVVGNGNPNAEKLKVFANHVNRKAEELYPGFGGRIIEKDYKFNQYVSDYHLLLEVGNNENTIEEAKMTGKYFADVLAEVIKDIE